MKQPTKPFQIHFVCRGNIYRSRLAAAYMATLLDGRFAVSSSGVEAAQGPIKTISPYARATAKVHQLAHQISAHNTQTTNKLLTAADVIIFMNKDVYDDALRMFIFDIRKALVWGVEDIEPKVARRLALKPSERAYVEAAAAAFKNIQRYCDELREYLTHTSWVDVVDEQNRSTGLRLPMAWATDRGLWHRGVHVVVQTPDGKFVVGKRTNDIVFAPGMLEISLGGGIDTGETPLQAARRETREELGVHLPGTHFRPLFTHRIHSFHPHYNKTTRGHVYVYAVTLPKPDPMLRPQPGEVAELRLLTKRQVRSMLRTHRVANFGRLKWDYVLYRKAVDYALASQRLTEPGARTL
jgi:protein-tyrosine-phosphatase/8-oxo-dGTP pyrophosphatase MutT (NUDIX family)